MFLHFRVSGNFKDKRGYKNFLSNFLCLTVPKKFTGKALVFHYFLLSRNFKDKRGYKDFLSNFLCLSVPKKFIGQSFTVSLNSGVNNFYG